MRNFERKRALNRVALGRSPEPAAQQRQGGADAYYAARRNAGLCGKCGKHQPLPEKTRCRGCWFKNVALNNTGTAKNATMLEEIWLEQGGRCAYTGGLLALGADASLDHRVPLLRGGTNDRQNLQWVSDMINRMKTNMTHDEFISMCRLIGGKQWL